MKPPKKCPNAALVAAGNKTGVLWMKKKEMQPSTRLLMENHC